MVRKIFKKHKDDQNKAKPRRIKRTIFAIIALSLSLQFGKTRWSSSQSSSSNFDNQAVQEIVIDDQEFCSLEDSDQQVILVRNNSSSPTVRPGLANGFSSHPPVNRPAGASGLKPVRANPVKGFSTPRGLITSQPVTGAHRQPTRLDGASNPAGAGGGASSDDLDQCPVSNKEQSQESETFDYDYRSNDPQKKKKLKDQCPIDQSEVNESFKSNSSLKKVTKRALGNQDVKREYKRILKRIGEGVDPMDIGRSSTDLGDGLTYVRGRHGRYVIKNDNGVKDVAGIAYRGSRNDMKTLAKEINKSYNVNIEPGGY